MAFKTHAMSLFATLYLGVLLIHLTNGQCRTDCRCVPSQPAPIGENRCCLSIRENQPPGSLVGNANQLALIADFVPAIYVFTPIDQAGTLLNLNRTTGAITTAAFIDRETVDCLQFVVRVRDAGDVPLAAPGRFGVVIEDENDNRPQFQPSVSILNITVVENDAPNTLNCENRSTELVDLQATDRDTGSNAEVTYKVAEGHGSALFTVNNPQHPCVDNLVPLDRENTSILYSFVLVAMDGGNPRMSSNITVIFTLEDVNDNAPVFPNATVNTSVLENATIGSVVYQFQATDLDLETQPLRYNLMYSNPIPFQINQETGKLNLTRALNMDTTDDKYHFTVLAIDSNSVHTSMLSVTITVIDVNELATLVPPNIPAELVEEVLADVFVIAIEDNDKSTENTMNVIRFASGGEYFRVLTIIKFDESIRQTFQIGQYTPIDRENVTNGVVQFSVIIEQMGNPPLEQRFQHNFTILDINDNEPYLITTQFNYTEDNDTQGQGTSSQTRGIQLKNYVRDDDAGENGTVTSFSLISVKSINERNFTEDFRRSNALAGVDQEIHDGNLLLPRPLDREIFGEALRVTMNFTDGGTPPLSRVDAFTIEIIDVNDNSPEFESSQYTFNLTENRSLDFIIGSVKAIDADDPIDNGRVVYSLDETRGDYEAFTVDQINGTIRNKRVFDRETKANYTFYISASDSGSPPKRAKKSAKVIVVISDVNDEPPAFETNTYTFNVINGANVGDFVGMVAAIDPDEDPTENQITYKFLVPTPYFSIDNSTGNIVLIKALSIQDSPYNVTVVACNPGFEHLRSTASISVVLVESSLSAAIIGGVLGGAAFILIVAIVVLCCCIVCVCHKSRMSGKLEVDRNGALNNQKPILKTLPATNGQQRSIKFSTNVEETHYDPSGIGEHSVIRKESNIVSGDDSLQTSLPTTVSNGAMSADSPEIVDYENNGDIPSHHRPQYPLHCRISSPIMLQEELNPSEFSQSEDEEAESTFSNAAPSNFNMSIPRFGRQTVQVEMHHHPDDIGRYAPPPTHVSLNIHHNLHSHLPPVYHLHGQHSSPAHLAELRADNLATLNAQYASSSHPPGVPPAEDIRDLSLYSLQCAMPQRLIQHPLPPPSIRQPPVSIPHSIITPAPSDGNANSRIYPHPLVIPEAFPSRRPSDIHRFNSFIPSLKNYGETSMYTSTELNEALKFKFEAEPYFCTLTVTDYGEDIHRTMSPIMLQEELNPSEFSQGTGSVVDDRNTYNSEGEDVESTFSDAPSISVPHFGRQAIQNHLPTHSPLDTHHDIHSYGQHSLPGHLAELRADNLAALNAQYASSSHPPGVSPAEDIQDLSLNSLPSNISHHHHGSTESSHKSTPPQRHIQRPLPSPSICQPPPVSIPHSIITPAPSNGHTNSRNYPHPLETFPSNVVNYNMSTNLGTNSGNPNSAITQESNSSRGAQSLQTCSDTFTVNSDPIFGNLPCSHTQISAATYTSSEGSSTDYAHLMLQANITYTNYDK